MRILPAGRRALLVEVADQAAALALHAQVEDRRAAGWAPGLTDVVPGACTVLLDGVDDLAGTARELAGWAPASERATAAAGRAEVIELPCVYDGEDLADIARHWGVREVDAVALHSGITYDVAFCGFSPGFAYLTGLPDELAVPRRAAPRTAVAAGSVGLAGAYTGVYPRRSPGGWQLIGHTDAPLWDLERSPAALLVPGTQVRFRPMSG